MNIDKIKDLMTKAGLKPELAGQICESLVQYTETIEEQYNTKFNERLERAKQVCLEECNSHKKDLTKRVQIFCESRMAEIDRVMRKQAMSKDTEATTKLKEVKSLLEGIKLDVNANGVNKQLKKLQASLATLKESRDKALLVAKRQTEIAEKALKRNKYLQEQVDKKSEVRQPVVEHRQRQDGKTPNGARPKTSRPPLVENQQMRQAPKPTNQTQRRLPTPADIANQIGE